MAAACIPARRCQRSARRYPHVQDLVAEGGWGLLSMELCGGMLGVPGITQAEPVQTLESVLKSYIKDESGDRGQGA